MTHTISLFVILIAMLSMAAAPAFPVEELFDSSTASKHMEQGVMCLKEKDFDAAIREFDALAAISPEADAFYYLGYAYYMKGKKGDGDARIKSLENFDKAFEIDPSFSPTRYKPPETAAQMLSGATSTEAPAAQQTPAPEQPK
jgi:tetratricopeptide (TPR) repeat protein